MAFFSIPLIGDRVGVVRKQDGTVHFFVNGVDQGACAANVPANVYGVIDLYGQAAQATIMDITGLSCCALSGADTHRLIAICFVHI